MNKKQNIKITLVLFISLLTSCIFKDEECPNGLIDYPFPYSNGQMLTFENEMGLTQNFEVIIELEGDLGDAPLGDPGHYDCGGSRSMTISDFTYEIVQTPNESSNYIYEYGYFDYYAIDFIIVDTIEEYKYHDEIVKAYYYLNVDTLPNYYNETDYLDFTMSEDRKLLDYSKKNNGIVEKWFLQ